MTLANWRTEWFGNVRADVLAGLVVALALIPEAIAFSIIAGVDPKVGLYASFSIAVIMAFVGGRPGMISAATGAMALLMVDLVKDHGLEYLFAATILTGIIQVIFGILKLGRLMQFVGQPVMTGFVNALAILIFMAQLPELQNVTGATYVMAAVGLGIIYGFPRITKAIPAPLVTIVLLTAATVWLDIDVRNVGDMGELPSSLPTFLIPDVPFNMETLGIIFPYALPLAIVGLMESLMTASLLDDLTDTPSDKNVESRGQGIANIATGFLGGMAGCAMIGQSVINVTSGGRGRLSTFIAGSVLLVLVVGLGDAVGLIPMPALVAVMIMVSIGTFDWGSITRLRTTPKSASAIMLAVVVVVVATNNLAYGVVLGVFLSGILFAWKISQIFQVTSHLTDDGRRRTYVVSGQVFFASVDRFVDSFNFDEAVEEVIIDATHAHFWDTSAIAALDKVVLKLRRDGADVKVVGLNEASATIVDRLAVHNKMDALDLAPGK
ncbi:MAG TPA: SulP family inorganic anion transporter [Thermomicrobiales bacterium]|nr:SulP family inorganic anion transporter [Thermomicrobiales bacterium]